MHYKKGERKMKRLTIAAIIAVMTVGVFTGCSSAGSQMTPAGNQSAQNGQENGTQSKVQNNNQNAEGNTVQNNAAQNNTGNQDIGEDAALQAALNAAGVSESDISRLQVSQDRDDGRLTYDVRFDVGQTEYDYEILASDGQILGSDVEQNKSGRQNTNNSGAAVSMEEATATALAKVPGAAENDIRIELERDDGRLIYEGNIIYQQMEYEFEIDANTGEVLSWSEERP